MTPGEPLTADDPRAIGPYQVVARLGAGGMGRVYLARSRAGRLVAIKLIRNELGGDSSFLRRFRREVAAARRVSGAFTAPVVDADMDADPPWLATAYVAGPTLSDAVTRHGPWPEPAARRLGAGLAEALESIHRAGVVHRDLKPSNILLSVDAPRVIDFGISAHAESTGTTGEGVMGTPGYLAPERLTGARAGFPADVFALGGVLVYVTTGHPPFGAGPPESVAYRVVHAEPDLHGVPVELREIIRGCLTRHPGLRPDVDTVLSALITGAYESDGDRWLPRAVDTAVRSLDLTEAPGQAEGDINRNKGDSAGPTRPWDSGGPTRPEHVHSPASSDPGRTLADRVRDAQNLTQTGMEHGERSEYAKALSAAEQALRTVRPVLGSGEAAVLNAYTGAAVLECGCLTNLGRFRDVWARADVHVLAAERWCDADPGPHPALQASFLSSSLGDAGSRLLTAAAMTGGQPDGHEVTHERIRAASRKAVEFGVEAIRRDPGLPLARTVTGKAAWEYATSYTSDPEDPPATYARIVESALAPLEGIPEHAALVDPLLSWARSTLASDES